MDIKKFCRTCETQTYLLLIDSVPNLQELLKTLLEIKPIAADEAICMKCIKTIEDFRDFRTKCKEIDERIRERVGIKDDEEQPPKTVQDVNQQELMDYNESIADSDDSTMPDPPVPGQLEMTLEEGEIGQPTPSPVSLRGSLGSKKPKQCKFCGKFYSNPSNLNRHINSAHSGASRQSKSDGCQSPNTPSIAATSNTYKRCYVCAAKFPTLVMLTKHMLTHNSVKPFKCEKCGQSFSLNQNLRRHQRTFCKAVIPKVEPEEYAESNYMNEQTE